MSPSTIDREFRSLSVDAGNTTESSIRQLYALLEALLEQLNTKRQYELTQAYLGLVLKVLSVYYIIYIEF